MTIKFLNAAAIVGIVVTSLQFLFDLNNWLYLWRSMAQDIMFYFGVPLIGLVGQVFWIIYLARKKYWLAFGGCVVIAVISAIRTLNVGLLMQGLVDSYNWINQDNFVNQLAILFVGIALIVPQAGKPPLVNDLWNCFSGDFPCHGCLYSQGGFVLRILFCL